MKKILFLLLLLFLPGCAIQEPIIPETTTGELTTEDNIEISYIYNKVNSDKAVILLHMLNRNKHDWNTFAVKLNQNNFSTLAIDLRGHGASQGNWEEFTEGDFKKIVLDVKATKEFLDNENYLEVYIIGGSIGANVALRYVAADNSINKVVLLSPSEDYRGVTTLDIINNYNGELLMATGSQDIQSYQGSLQLNETFTGDKELVIYNTNSHGTNLLLSYNELGNKIVEFLKK